MEDQYLNTEAQKVSFRFYLELNYQSNCTFFIPSSFTMVDRFKNHIYKEKYRL